MISQAESGLSAADYAKLAAEHLNPGSSSAYKVIAHKTNLEFTTHTTFLDSNAGQDFDAMVLDDFIYRVYGTQLQYISLAVDNGDDVSPENYSPPTSPKAGAVPSIIADGSDNIRVHIITDTGIERCTGTDSQTPFSAWETIVTDSNVTQIAAVTDERVHYVVEDASKGIYQLRCAEWNGASWDVIQSDIWWTSPVTSFVAVNYGGQDVIVLIGGVPGDTALRVVNDQVSKFVYSGGGLVSFTYKYKTWSDHVEIDTLTTITPYRYRLRAKLSVVHGRLIATAFTGEGDYLYNYSAYRMYACTDPRFWSRGEIFDLEGLEGGFGIKLLANGDNIYAVERQKSWKSPSTLKMGYSPASQQIDITNEILEYELSHEGMLQASVVIDNSTGWLDNHAILSRNGTFALQHFLGYWLTDTEGEPQTTPTLVLQGTTEVDYFGSEDNLPEKYVKITGRDFLGRMSDFSQAEQPRYWQNQLVAADNYQNDTNTNYGGLRHTASQSGSWGTRGNALELFSNNKEGIAFSTFSPYIWNGVTQVDFNLDRKNNSEFGGVIFRASDKDNGWLVLYRQADDKVHLIERRAGKDKTKHSSSAMSWSSQPKTVRYLRAEFRYAQIKVYTSTDGRTWTTLFTYLVDGEKVESFFPKVVVARNERGFVGTIGRGYSPEDQWKITSPDYPIPGGLEDTWVDDPRNTIENFAIAWNDLGQCARTANFTQNGTEWDNFSPDGDYVVVDMDWDHDSDFIKSGYEEGALGVWAAAHKHDYSVLYALYCPDVLALDAADNWVVKRTQAVTSPIPSDLGPSFYGQARIRCCPDEPGYVALAYANAVGTQIHRTSNAGSSWTAQAVGYQSTSPNDATRIYPIGLDLKGERCYVTAQAARGEWTMYFALTKTGGFSRTNHSQLSTTPQALPNVVAAEDDNIYVNFSSSSQQEDNVEYFVRFSDDDENLAPGVECVVAGNPAPVLGNFYAGAGNEWRTGFTGYGTFNTGGSMWLSLTVTLPEPSQLISPEFLLGYDFSPSTLGSLRVLEQRMKLTSESEGVYYDETILRPYPFTGVGQPSWPAIPTKTDVIEAYYYMRVTDSEDGDVSSIFLNNYERFYLFAADLYFEISPPVYPASVWRIYDYYQDNPRWVRSITPDDLSPSETRALVLNQEDHTEIMAADGNTILSADRAEEWIIVNEGSHDGARMHGDNVALWANGALDYSIAEGRDAESRLGDFETVTGSDHVQGVLLLE